MMLSSLSWVLLATLLGGLLSAALASVFLLLLATRRNALLPHLISLATGAMLAGVKFGKSMIETETVVMRSASATVRWIRAEHRKLDKFE